jgi:hypothetical protein
MNKVKLSMILAAVATAASCAIGQDDNPLTTPPPPAPGAPAVPGVAPVPPVPPVTAQPFALQADALEASKVQLAQSARALADSQKQLAQAAVARELPGAYGWSTSGGLGSSSKRALVIPKDGEAKGVAEIEEDMGVMAHILDKAISNDGKTSKPMGITVFGLPSSGGGQNLFIEGYGAIFFASVNFPLLPPAAKEKESDHKEKANSEWEDAKRELARPGRGGGDFFVFEQDLDTVHWSGRGAEYDADKVEDLKKDLLTALKNAGNIRKLKSDETITVVVTGGRSGSNRVKTTYSPGPKTEPGPAKRVSSATSESGKLIIRARKSDTESFLNGKLNFDDFRKRATVLLY